MVSRDAISPIDWSVACVRRSACKLPSAPPERRTTVIESSLLSALRCDREYCCDEHRAMDSHFSIQREANVLRRHRL